MDQIGGDTLHRLGSLYTLLTGRNGQSAFEDRQTAKNGTMARLTTAFSAELAALATYEDWQATAQRWFSTKGWPPNMQLGGVRGRVLSWSIVCRKAKEKGHSVYAWEGPEVPTYGVAHGAGPESYEAYRKAKGLKPTPKGAPHPPEPPEGR